jgi:septal ring factor EnvC (AmiA/AmiB activator)
MNDNLRGAPADDLEELIGSATTVIESRADAANEMVATLWMMKSNVLKIEDDLRKYRAELARLQIEIEQRRQGHQQLEASLVRLRDYIAKNHEDRADYVKRLDEVVLLARKDREDLQRRIKLTLARAA